MTSLITWDISDDTSGDYRIISNAISTKLISQQPHYSVTTASSVDGTKIDPQLSLITSSVYQHINVICYEQSSPNEGEKPR